MVKIKLSSQKGEKIMVKGVSKRIIEVNNTGNKFFEKIVIYVTPEYGNLSPSKVWFWVSGTLLTHKGPL